MRSSASASLLRARARHRSSCSTVLRGASNELTIKILAAECTIERRRDGHERSALSGGTERKAQFPQGYCYSCRNQVPTTLCPSSWRLSLPGAAAPPAPASAEHYGLGVVAPSALRGFAPDVEHRSRLGTRSASLPCALAPRCGSVVWSVRSENHDSRPQLHPGSAHARLHRNPLCASFACPQWLQILTLHLPIGYSRGFSPR